MKLKMRLFTVLMLLVLVKTAVFARPAAPVTQAASYKLVDKLNDISYDVYLQSPDSARKVAEKALLLSEKLKYSFGIGRSFLNIGYVYWSQSYYPIALFYLNKAMTSLPADKPLYISDCYNTIGRTYADLNNFSEATKNLDMSERYAGNDAGRLAETYSVQAYVYMKLKNYKKAIRYARQALILNKIGGDQSNVAIVYARLSDIYNRKGDPQMAIAYSDTAYKMAIATHNNRLKANDYVEYALIYQQLKNYNRSISYARKAAALADSIGVVDAATDAYSTLISCYEQQHQLNKAMAFQKEYDRMRDSLNRFDQTKNTELIQSYFTLNSRLNDIALAEHDSQERATLTKTILVAMYKLVLLFACNLAVLAVCYFFNYYHTSSN